MIGFVPLEWLRSSPVQGYMMGDVNMETCEPNLRESDCEIWATYWIGRTLKVALLR